MPDHSFSHYVFVDFENVPKVDLSLIKGRAAYVTLLIGKKQTKLETGLSLQLNQFAGQVNPVQVEASGRNALDMILAGYLGRAVQKYPGAEFHVVSRDKDFTPLIEHLQNQGIRVSRHDAFASLPFLAPAGKSPAKLPFAVQPATAIKPKAPAPAKPAADKLPKFIAHLRNSPPANRTKLEHMITAYFKPSLPAGGMKGVITELVKRKAIAIDGAGKVTRH